MITRARIVDHRIVKDATIDLERLTLLVGPNGCGKSTVMEGIAGMARAMGVTRPQAKDILLSSSVLILKYLS